MTDDQQVTGEQQVRSRPTGMASVIGVLVAVQAYIPVSYMVRYSDAPIEATILAAVGVAGVATLQLTG